MTLSDVNNATISIISSFVDILNDPPISYFVAVFIIFAVFALIVKIIKS